jgi:two-component system cell cycle sensor histidine kinase/response regulator CckA
LHQEVRLSAREQVLHIISHSSQVHGCPSTCPEDYAWLKGTDSLIPEKNNRILTISELEGLVETRTQELYLANERLQAEMAERRRYEEERKVLEHQLVETQRLESLGILAGIIAHDFNNILTSILGNTSLARMELPADSPVQQDLEHIEKASLRAADLCKRVLAYAGKDPISMKKISLSHLISETARILKISISKNASLQLDLSETLPPMMGDARQIGQILINLVHNASDAIEASGRQGTISIKTGISRISCSDLKNMIVTNGMAEGDSIFLEVSDDGCGMTDEIKARIFEPFHTTGSMGHGLGLSAVLSIVKQHKGTLGINSAPGAGTAIRLIFPHAEAVCFGITPKKEKTPDWHGSGLVLVADDEESVRNVAAKCIESFGFQVLQASDGNEAVAVFQEHAKQIVAVLMDLTMPGMNGHSACRKIKQIQPCTQIFLMSGYPENDPEVHFADELFAGFIQKPFLRTTIGDKLRARLESPGIVS